MKKRLILHDLSDEQGCHILPPASEATTIFPAAPSVKPCIGCFGCWIKTPGKCVIKDRADEFPVLMATHAELVIVSRMVFGGLSPDIKAVLDRSIGFILPFFRIVGGEMHHVERYEKSPDLKYIFYDHNISERDKEVARKLVAANGINFGSHNCEAVFCNCVEDITEVFV